MESKINTYRLSQNNKEYILTVSLQGQEINTTFKDSAQGTSITKKFTLESLKALDSIFNKLQTPMEAFLSIDHALKFQKVRVVEENSSVKLVFHIRQDTAVSQVVIPLKGDIGIVSNSDNNIFENTTTQTQLIQGSNIATNINEANFIKEIGIDPENVYKQTNNENTAQIIQSIEDEYKLHLAQNKIADTNVYNASIPDQLPTEINNINVENKIDTNQFQESSYQIQENITNIENIPELNQYTTTNLVTQNEETNIDLTQFKTENIQEINQAPISNQFNIEEYQATTKTDTTEFNGEFLNKFDSNPIVQPIETQNIEQNIDIKTEEYVPTSFDNTQTVETQNIEPNIDMKTEEYTPTSYDNTFQQPIEMQQNIEQKVDIKAEEFVPTSYDNTQIFETQNIEQNVGLKPEEYIPTTYDNTQTFETQAIEQNVDIKAEEYIPTTYDNTQTYETQNIEQTTDIKAEEYIPNTYENNTIGEINQINTSEATTLDMGLGNIEQNNYAEYQQYQETAQFDKQNLTNNEYDNTNIITTENQENQESLLVKLEDDTNKLRNEQQLVQGKITNLLGQVNIYKNQLESFGKDNVSNQIITLREENNVMKQQLSEMDNLRNEAFDLPNLRNQMSLLSPLRRKVGEIDDIKAQLNELQYLRERVSELSQLKNELGEIDNLKAKVEQLNSMKQQLDEINVLKARFAQMNNAQPQISNQDEEKEILKRKLEELEALNIRYEQEIKDLKENKIKEEKEENNVEKKEEDKEVLAEGKMEFNTLKGDIIHSQEELDLLTNKINKNNKKLTLNLLYKATVDSDEAQAFHQKCDEAKNSLVLVETDKGKRFGGFTTCSWKGNGDEKMDEEAFVFSLNKLKTYDNNPEEEAIGCYPKFGPIFLGCQIRIYDNAFTKGGTTFEKGCNFKTEEDFELTEGDRIFNVKEIEVYEVILE